MKRKFVCREQGHVSTAFAFVEANWRAMAGSKFPLEIVVRPLNCTRKVEQNGRYQALLRDIAEQAYVDGKSFDRAVWHEYFKKTFIGVQDLPDGGIIGKSSAKLSVKEFSEFIAEVEAYAVGTLGVKISARAE